MQRIVLQAARKATRPLLVTLAALALAGGSYAAAALLAAKPPAPTITSGPEDPTTERTATFTFSDAQAGVSFRCRLDGGAFSACSSPKRYDGLSEGDHSFQVQALDAAGNASLPTTYAWTAPST